MVAKTKSEIRNEVEIRLIGYDEEDYRKIHDATSILLKSFEKFKVLKKKCIITKQKMNGILKNPYIHIYGPIRAQEILLPAIQSVVRKLRMIELERRLSASRNVRFDVARIRLKEVLGVDVSCH